MLLFNSQSTEMIVFVHFVQFDTCFFKKRICWPSDLALPEVPPQDLFLNAVDTTQKLGTQIIYIPSNMIFIVSNVIQFFVDLIKHLSFQVNKGQLETAE